MNLRTEEPLTPRASALLHDMNMFIRAAESWVGIDDNMAKELFQDAKDLGRLLVRDGYLTDLPGPLRERKRKTRRKSNTAERNRKARKQIEREKVAIARLGRKQ